MASWRTENIRNKVDHFFLSREFYNTVICFVSISFNFGICTVVGLNRKIHTFNFPSAYFSFNMCPTTVQMPNWALIETKWMKVQV
jgi:hypothetical protein